MGLKMGLSRTLDILLGGLQKYSLIDYPGKISCVVFLSGCNFHCPYCHNPDLVKGNRFANPETLQDYLAAYQRGMFDEDTRMFLVGVQFSF